MASRLKSKVLAFIAGESLSSDKYKILKFGTSDKHVIKQSSSGAKCMGVLNESGKASGEQCEVQVGGHVKVLLGGTVTRGDSIMSNASALGIAGTATNWCIGHAMQSGVSGDIIEVQFNIHQLN
jgi:hypothetical protein